MDMLFIGLYLRFIFVSIILQSVFYRHFALVILFLGEIFYCNKTCKILTSTNFLKCGDQVCWYIKSKTLETWMLSRSLYYSRSLVLQVPLSLKIWGTFCDFVSLAWKVYRWIWKFSKNLYYLSIFTVVHE